MQGFPDWELDQYGPLLARDCAGARAHRDARRSADGRARASRSCACSGGTLRTRSRSSSWSSRPSSSTPPAPSRRWRRSTRSVPLACSSSRHALMPATVHGHTMGCARSADSGALRDSRLPPGNPEALTKQIWAGPAYVVTTALSAAIVHGFLIFRFYTLSKQAALTAFYIFCAACALSGGLAAAIVLRLYPLVSQRNKSIITAIVWFSACTPDRPPAGADGRSPQPPRVRRTCASPSASGGRSRRCSPASGARRGECYPCVRAPPLTAVARQHDRPREQALHPDRRHHDALRARHALRLPPEPQLQRCARPPAPRSRVLTRAQWRTR
jgi:hypothetical protein